jgi:hypothetical protein
LVDEDSTKDNLKIITKRQKSREWKLRNKKRVSEYNKQYYKENQDYEIQRAREYRIKNIEQHNNWSKTRTLYFKNIIYDILGRKCVRCGYDDDIDCLQLDHINGNGRKQRGSKSIRNFYCYYASNHDIIKSDLQILCVNCNWLKRLEDREKRLKSNPQVLKNTKSSEYFRTYSIMWRQKQKHKLFKILGGSICIRCKQNNEMLLQIDHIEDGGTKERRIFTNNYLMLNFYINNPNLAKHKLQVLCCMCNWKKMLESKR